MALAVDPRMVRRDRLAPSTDFHATGVLGDPSRATAAYGEQGLAIQVDGAVKRIRELVEDR